MNHVGVFDDGLAVGNIDGFLSDGDPIDDPGHRILQENIGNSWNMEAVLVPKIARWIPVNFLCFPAGTGLKSPEPPVSGPGCSTWDLL